MTSLFNPASQDENHFLLASHLPRGDFFKEAFNKDDDFGKLFFALAMEFYRFQVLEKKLVDEMDITKTNELLVEWEKSVGIPGQCFKTNISDEKRRVQVYQKFSKFGGAQKNEDFVRVAAAFDIDVTIETGRERGRFPMTFPLLLVDDKAATNIFYVTIGGTLKTKTTFALPFPIPFSEGKKDFIQCIFDFLAAATVKVIITN